MTTLHIVRQSAFNTNDFAQCTQTIKAQDTLVFIDDGCYNLSHPLMDEIPKKVAIKVLALHAKARNLSVINKEQDAWLSLITMEDLVNLTLSAKNTITWQ